MSQLTVNKAVKLRRSPEILPDNILVSSVPAGQLVDAREGSAVCDGYNWRRVTWNNIPGWCIADVLAALPAATVSGEKIGIHILGDFQTALNYLQQAQANGKPVRGATVVQFGQGVNVSGIKAVSPQTAVVLRRYDNNWENNITQAARTSSDYWKTLDLTTTGKALFDLYYRSFIAPDGDAQQADYHQIINEPEYGPGTASWWLGAMAGAEAVGVKLAVGNFSSGRPKLPLEDPTFWNSMLPVLRRIKSGGHILNLHQYVPQGGDNWSDVWTIARHRQLYAQLPADVQDTPLSFSEYGDGSSLRGGVATFVANVKTAKAMIDADPYVQFGNLWTWGDGGSALWTADKIDGALSGLLGL